MTNEALGSESSDNFSEASLDHAAEAWAKRMNPEDSSNQQNGEQDDANHDEEDEQPSEQDEESDDNESDADDESEQSEDDADDSKEGFADVEIEGKIYQVPVELKDGYLRQSDYTKKTTELAERTRLAESNLAQASLMTQYADAVAEVKAKLMTVDSQIAYYEQKIDWNTIRVENPGEFAALFGEYNDAKASKRDIQAALQSLPARFAQESEANLAKHREEAKKDVMRRIPGWNQQTEAEIVQYGISMGFTQQELRNGALDPRMIQVLNEARMYRNLKDKKPQVTKKVPNGEQKVVKPGASRQGNRVDLESEAKARLQKTKTTRAAEDLWAARLEKGGLK